MKDRFDNDVVINDKVWYLGEVYTIIERSKTGVIKLNTGKWVSLNEVVLYKPTLQLQ